MLALSAVMPRRHAPSGVLSVSRLDRACQGPSPVHLRDAAESSDDAVGGVGFLCAPESTLIDEAAMLCDVVRIVRSLYASRDVCDPQSAPQGVLP
jgi:hypothetical protein